MASWSDFEHELIASEGSISHMYLDTVGKVTVGVGNMIPNAATAQQLRFVLRNTRQAASPQQIRAEFDTISKQPKGKVASTYKIHTTMDLPQSEITRLMRDRIESLRRELKNPFPSFDSYPITVQFALVDMAFNLGLKGLVDKFPKFNKAVLSNDWQTAAKESNRPQLSASRNMTVKTWIEKASASTAASSAAASGGYFSHVDEKNVTLKYGENAVKLNNMAASLMRSILAASGMKGATLTSTLRTYHDQARITITQTYKSDPSKVSTWYGDEVLQACKQYLKDIDGFAKWWEAYDKKRGKVSSKHLSNKAMDVVPDGDRLKFVAKVRELVPVKGSGVSRIIPKGEMKEPVDHVEFTFEVT